MASVPITISVRGLPIEKIVMGTGPLTVLMWSQMHGNESTTTKGVADLLNALVSGLGKSEEMLRKLTLVVIPLLNPDGALSYTRENANGVDLNRDAQARTQPESRALRETYTRHSPDFCFNLHDQRTIFSAGPEAHPATLSFLSPAADPSRRITASRHLAMQVISKINRELQKEVPGQIGRYDDAFNPNCVGDTFQMLETPTILFEAGHYPDDYQREQTRKYVFKALWVAIESLAYELYRKEKEEGYHEIPENEKRFFDILIRNAHLIRGGQVKKNDIGILFREKLKGGIITFDPYIEKEGVLKDFHGHLTFDCGNPGELQTLENNRGIMELLLSGMH